MNKELETVLLVRHARSTANDDVTVYQRVPDHAIPLARPEDDPAARAAGAVVAAMSLLPGSLCAWSSTYLRCKQTREVVLGSAFGAAAMAVPRRESFLLREQEFGDWDGLTEEQMLARDPERFAKRKRMTDAAGRFYFRYPSGESRADVVQRCSIFVGKMHRSRYRHHLVFLHGVTQRALRMAWFNHSVEWFEDEANPGNCSVLLIRRDPERHQWVEQYLPLDPASAAAAVR
jgi:broad specificity phosphatase PhoE